MVVGTLEVRLLIRESRSLKDKRQVVRSINDRMRNAFNVSVAEVDKEDNRQLAVLGFAMVGTEVRGVRTCLDKIVTILRGHPIAEFLSHQIEV